MVSILIMFAYTVLASDNVQLFNNLKVKDGLPVNEISTINQDSTGFMWFGTVNGLIRYDGYNMKVFRKFGNRKTALPDNQITSIANHRNLGLWAGSYEGLTYFDTQTWESRAIDLGKPREVRCLLMQGDTLLWVGTSEGLIQLNTNTFTYHVFNEQNSLLGSNIIRSLYIDSESNLWIGTFNGLNFLSSNNQMEHFNLKGNYKPELKNNLILEIQPFTKTNDTQLWIGTETGLVLFNRISKQFKVFNAQNTGFGNEVVKCIITLTEGEIYFGTDFGFYRFHANSDEFNVSLHDPFNNYSLANNVVWDIFQDNAGIIWLATSNGISQLNVNQGMFRFAPVFHLDGNRQVGNQINAIYCSPDGTTWLATKNGVLAQFANNTSRHFSTNRDTPHPLVMNNINTIRGDYLGRIWIGSAGGINVWDPAKNKMHTITANFNLNRGLRSNYISAFITPADGSFWVSTWGGGLYRATGDFTNMETIQFEYIADVNTNIFTCEKKIWLANKNKVFTIDLTTLQITEQTALNTLIGDRTVGSLHFSEKGILWAGLGNQLLSFNPGTSEHLVYEVLTGNQTDINNLTEDFNGDIWGTTLTSIFRFTTAEKQVDLFPMNKSIPLDIFQAQSFCRSKTGKIFLGGNDGYISFMPNEIRKNTFCPKTVITSLKVNNNQVETIDEIKGRNRSNKLISYYPKIVLKYGQNSISINFSALHLGDPHRNVYAYKLEGFEKEWNYTTGFQNNATYSNLSPDKYIFKVKGTNNDGVWFENEAVLAITVKPPIWASAWAIVIYLILLQVILTALFLTYRNKVRFKAEINSITIEKEKNEALALAKQQFFTNVSHEFRTPLSLMIGPVQTILDKHKIDSATRGLLLLVLKNTRRLLSLVNQLMDIRNLENQTLKLTQQSLNAVEFCREQFSLFVDAALNRNIQFSFEAPDLPVTMVTDADKLESIVQNLLSNAFKFTPDGGTIILTLEVNDLNELLINVSDSGIGIHPDEREEIFARFYQGKQKSEHSSGYGIGLHLVREYCERMNGSIWFESTLGEGAKFSVKLPLQTNFIQNEAQTTTILSTDNSQNSKKSNIQRTDDSLQYLLLVDDNPDTTRFISMSLAGKFNFVFAHHGKEALKQLENHKIDLIISDVMMPEIDGVSLCSTIKSNPRFAKIPIILLTANTSAEGHADGYRAGADDYLIKPFNTEILEARVESLLNRVRKTEEYIKQQLIVENREVEVESYPEKLLQETIQYINLHINDPEINVDKMCKSIGVSHSSLYRKIKSQTGLTLNELIRQVKMKRAAQLIRSKKLTITEIMDETGFNNHSYFAKCFKKEFNMSPREYAEKHT